MKFVKSSLITAAGIAALMAGCTSTEGNPSGSTNAGSDELPDIQVASCEEITDKEALAILDEAQSDIASFMEAFAEGDFKTAQKKTAVIKSAYGGALKAHPGNCEAQVGYALATVANIINNKELNDVIDTISSIISDEASASNNTSEIEMNDVDVQASLYKLSSSEASKIIVKSQALAKDGSSKVITTRLQEAIADELLPAVDTAITYLQSVVDDGKFSTRFIVEKDTIALDNGEFGPAVAALYVTRAIMTALVSFNIDVSKDGKYDWIDSLIRINDKNYKTNVGAKYAVELLGRDNPFGTVKSEWKDRYKKIPDDLEKAIDYVKYGFEYKLYEAENGLDQSNDPYVVGDGEDVDMSVKEVNKIIDSLEYYKAGLHGDIDIALSKKRSIKVNLGKFFELTSDIKGYAPYYKMVQPENWFSVGSNTEWAPEIYHSYAAYFAERQLEEELLENEGVEYASVYFDDEETDNTVLSFYVEYADGSGHGYFDINVKDCKAEFSIGEFDYYSYVDEEKEVDPVSLKSYDLGKDFCKVDGGESLLAQAGEDLVPNVLNFTDKDGKVTISFADIASENFDVKDLRKYIVFPDYSFGGMFPEMTKDQFWDIMDESIQGSADYDEEDD